MSIQKILQALKNYQKTSKSKRQSYMDVFEERMLYRTTKTENPQTTPKMVQAVLAKLKST